MYAPEHFSLPEVEACHRIALDNSFGELITTDAAGAPFATHLPFLLEPARGQKGVLLGHMARANPQWRHFSFGRPALAMFHGPHAYVSPTYYVTHPAVPTWNYIAVHAYGTPRIIEDPQAVLEILRRLSEVYEAANGSEWRMERLGENYLDARLGGVVAFELPIERWEGKAKLSQNLSVEDRRRVASALAGSRDPNARALAQAMEALG